MSPAFSLATSLSLADLAARGRWFTSFNPTLVLSGSRGETSLYGEIAIFTPGAGPATATRTQYIFGASQDVGRRLQADLETAKR